MNAIAKFPQLPLFFLAILIESAIVVVYLLSIAKGGTPPAFLDMNGYLTLPSLLQAFQLLTISTISGFLWWCRLPPPPSRRFLAAIAILLFYGGCDELFKIHLRLLSGNWFALYIGLVATLPILFWRDFWRLGWNYPKPTAIAAFGFGIFLLGGFFSHWVSVGLIQPWLSVGVEPTRIAFEEYFELVGENFVLLGVARFVRQKLPLSQTGKG